MKILILFSLCFPVFADETGAPREPSISIELGAGQVKVDVDSLDLPPEVLARLETELMVDDRLAGLVTAPTVQRLTLDPETTAMIVADWRKQTQSTADMIRQKILFQIAGVEEKSEPERQVDEQLEKFLHGFWSDGREQWRNWHGYEVVQDWFAGWKLVITAILSLVWSWLVLLLIGLLLPGSLHEALALSKNSLFKSLLAGFAALILFLPGMIFLTVTIVGIVLLPIYFALALLVVLMSYPLAVYVVGARLLEDRPLFLQVALGSFILGLITGILPILGTIVNALVMITALGLILRLFMQRIWSTN